MVFNAFHAFPLVSTSSLAALLAPAGDGAREAVVLHATALHLGAAPGLLRVRPASKSPEPHLKPSENM